MNDVYLVELYDYYGDLLTDKQKKYFEAYYFDNLSLSEMSENYSISRNAVSKQLLNVKEKLSHYEKILNLKKKSEKINDLIKNINVETQNEIQKLI
jgi:predicted DNA-binding protein YlxM (UPF0122 family)